MSRPLVVRFAVVLAALPVMAACAQVAELERTRTFCVEASTLLRDLADDLGAADSSTDQLDDLVAEAVERLELVEPPAEVATQWTFLVDEWTSARDHLVQADGDFASPAGIGAFAEFSLLQGQLADASTVVDDWGRANC
jgi:hypothetical protein